MTGAVRRYRLTQKEWPRFVRTLAWTGLVLIAGILGLVWFRVLSLLDALWFLGPVGAGYLLYGLQRQRTWYRSFEIVVDDERVVRRAAGSPDMEIRRTDIREVGDGPGGCLLIETGRPDQRFLVPGQLEGISELKNTLDSWLEQNRASKAGEA